MYQASSERYSEMKYRRCGKSGLMLPAISLGLWQNFGSVNVMENCIEMIHTAFDLGITHFDLANNYGPLPGSAEENFGRIMAKDMTPYRDEMIISSKAGYTMWPGPYGDWGSRKYLIASCDQSLKRMGLEYVDIFYHHRPDPNTPLEESMGALDSIVRSGKALYAGISNYTVITSGKDSSRFWAATESDVSPSLRLHRDFSRTNISMESPQTPGQERTGPFLQRISRRNCWPKSGR